MLGGTLLLVSVPIRAQKAKPRVALPFGGTERTSAHLIEALKQGMLGQGYPDGSVEYDVRYANGQIPLQEPIVAELVARNPDAIVVAGPPFVRASLKVTRTIPIVMANVSNPVGNKFIDSLARPGGNVTGIATLYEALLPKIAETLHALVPSASRVAVLLNENNPSTSAFWQSVETALQTLGKTPFRMNAFTEPQIVEAFEQMRATRIQATIVVADNTFVVFRDRIATLAQAARMPAAYALREHVAAGGLVSYGPSLSGNYRASARYVAQILKGVKPADLPVEQPSKFELVINRKAADSLGIKIPPAVLLRADEVIE
ncbi:MAG: hypothetical protein A3F77_13595 [Betaproteobacteria bacterium RIFCSPLOWO2_12_FULL_67_28]|nr:MAG: hypothetical protein A3I65_02995 [Betaproteobacteria bacterium RIFCSPLOWO2_02_FULL_68_150]OGA71991.1 MAG: hypothetical protein A3F77_13595 [Betaproteobacteria bacterium RIFCSPLOWO2_12_FULL_67_28]